MFNIILVATNHIEKGKCNSDELFRILDKISPEVIFDEMPSSHFEKYFSEEFDQYCINRKLLNQPLPYIPLEVISIKKFNQHSQIEIFPVDIDTTQAVYELQHEVAFMTLVFTKHEDYLQLFLNNEYLIAQEGFYYLNSDRFMDYLEQKEILEKRIIETEEEKDRLLNIYQVFNELQKDYREKYMLQNIYAYSKTKKFNKAVLLIGAEHKKSILRKISEHDNFSEVKLNWEMCDNILRDNL